MSDSRLSRAQLNTRVGPHEDADKGFEAGCIAVRAPNLGMWRDGPKVGETLAPGASVGSLEQLGASYELKLPKEAFGRVLSRKGERARVPCEYDELLLVLDPRAGQQAGAGADFGSATATGDAATGFSSPSSGRYYARPGPDRDPFLSEGQELRGGEAVGLLEVMKTFTRIVFQPPEGASGVRVTKIRVQDEADVDEGELLFEYETL